MTTYQLPRLRPDRLSDAMVGMCTCTPLEYSGETPTSIPPQMNPSIITRSYVYTILAISVFLLPRHLKTLARDRCE